MGSASGTVAKAAEKQHAKAAKKDTAKAAEHDGGVPGVTGKTTSQETSERVAKRPKRLTRESLEGMEADTIAGCLMTMFGLEDPWRELVMKIRSGLMNKRDAIEQILKEQDRAPQARGRGVDAPDARPP